MKKNILLFTLLFSVFTAFGQGKEYSFPPKWKVGDKKTLTIVQHQKEIKMGRVIVDTTITAETKLQVMKEDKDSYILKLLYKNIALQEASFFYEKAADELKKYRELEIKYRIDKQTGKAEIANWKEAQSFMQESVSQIQSLLEKKSPKMLVFAKLTLAPIEEAFSSKESVEAYMKNEIGYLLFAYDKKFVAGDTLKVVESGPNPFSPLETVNQTTISYLSNISEVKGACDINTSVQHDLNGFKEMMKGVMRSMATSFGAADSTMNKAAKEIDNIDFDIKNQTVISFDYKTTWPTKVVTTVNITASDPKGKKEKIVTRTVTVK